MKIENLINQIKQKKSFLCVGLDVDLNKIPKHLHKFDDPIFEFSKEIIDSTSPFAIVIPIATAFFKSRTRHFWFQQLLIYDALTSDCTDSRVRAISLISKHSIRSPICKSL